MVLPSVGHWIVALRLTEYLGPNHLTIDHQPSLAPYREDRSRYTTNAWPERAVGMGARGSQPSRCQAK